MEFFELLKIIRNVMLKMHRYQSQMLKLYFDLYFMNIRFLTRHVKTTSVSQQFFHKIKNTFWQLVLAAFHCKTALETTSFIFLLNKVELISIKLLMWHFDAVLKQNKL